VLSSGTAVNLRSLLIQESPAQYKSKSSELLDYCADLFTTPSISYPAHAISWVLHDAPGLPAEGQDEPNLPADFNRSREKSIALESRSIADRVFAILPEPQGAQSRARFRR
jgi:hypothetical protein